MANVNDGYVTVLAKIKAQGEDEFPIVDAQDVAVKNEDGSETTLDEKLKSIEENAGGGNTFEEVKVETTNEYGDTYTTTIKGYEIEVNNTIYKIVTGDGYSLFVDDTGFGYSSEGYSTTYGHFGIVFIHDGNDSNLYFPTEDGKVASGTLATQEWVQENAGGGSANIEGGVCSTPTIIWTQLDSDDVDGSRWTINLDGLDHTSIDWGDGTINNEDEHTYGNCENPIIKVYGNTYIRDRAFVGTDENSWLWKIDISDSVIDIGIEAFSGCSMLEYVRIGKCVKEIQSRAFSDSSSSLKMIVDCVNIDEVSSDIFENRKNYKLAFKDYDAMDNFCSWLDEYDAHASYPAMRKQVPAVLSTHYHTIAGGIAKGNAVQNTYGQADVILLYGYVKQNEEENGVGIPFQVVVSVFALQQSGSIIYSYTDAGRTPSIGKIWYDNSNGKVYFNTEYLDGTLKHVGQVIFRA